MSIVLGNYHVGQEITSACCVSCKLPGVTRHCRGTEKYLPFNCYLEVLFLISISHLGSLHSPTIQWKGLSPATFKLGSPLLLQAMSRKDSMLSTGGPTAKVKTRTCNKPLHVKNFWGASEEDFQAGTSQLKLAQRAGPNICLLCMITWSYSVVLTS